MGSDSYRYKFSIVMAVYNVEKYLAEAINSIICQSIGFEKNVQLILVDDGTPDNSGDMCDLYAERYPKNIKVIHKHNGGVSSARNEGLKYVVGKYVNFMDSDDKLFKNALEEVYNFFEKHYSEVDLISIPIVFFGSRDGDHPLNYKFNNGNRVVDLNKEYDHIQLSMSSTFTKISIAKYINFDPNLKYAEDAKECVRILLKKNAIGVVASTKYLYRRHMSSAIGKAGMTYDWYIPYMIYFQKYIKDMTEIKYGKMPTFVQFTLMYDLQWRICYNYDKTQSILCNEEQEEYKKLLIEILQGISDNVILEQRNIQIWHILYAFFCKYKLYPIITQEGENYWITYNDNKVLNINALPSYWDFFSYNNDEITLEGRSFFIANNNNSSKSVIIINDKIVYPNEVSIENIRVMGVVVLNVQNFKINFTTSEYIKHDTETVAISLYSEFNEHRILRDNIIMSKFFPIDGRIKKSYMVFDKYTLTHGNGRLYISKNYKWLNLFRELSISKDLLLNDTNKAAKKAAFLRLLIKILLFFKKKEYWILSDRINKADDNGEALLIYLKEKKLNIDINFAIRSDCEDYINIKKVANVLDMKSRLYKMKFLLADKIISSSADDITLNPFNNYRQYYKDIMFKQKRIFLQHGIIKDDLSDWLKRTNKDLSMFVTSARIEYNSIISGKYLYDENVVKLTGLPRYDRLIDAKKRQIVIMPTWRHNLICGGAYNSNGYDQYGDEFLESEYYMFYNGLLSNNRINEVAAKYGYIIKFMPHPRVITNIKYFKKGSSVEFCDISTKYRDIFSESALIVTDYSSVAFDFAYLRKPVVYCQFDRDTFFEGAVYDKGYFSYEDNGFGEVTYDLEKTIDLIIEYIENGCLLKKKYRQRINSFFSFNDRNNCQRVLEAILSLRE